ncbi:MAG TPA: transposase [Blastocatellia bacterium]|nr:transposase [Blastocatellia bacterium]
MKKTIISSRRVFTREFKVAAVKELDSGKAPAYVARRLGVHLNVLYRWRREFIKNPAKAFSGNGKKMLDDSHEAELERKIGQMTMEIDFLRKLLRTFEEQREADGEGVAYTRRSARKINR